MTSALSDVPESDWLMACGSCQENSQNCKLQLQLQSKTQTFGLSQKQHRCSTKVWDNTENLGFKNKFNYEQKISDLNYDSKIWGQ